MAWTVRSRGTQNWVRLCLKQPGLWNVSLSDVNMEWFANATLGNDMLRFVTCMISKCKNRYRSQSQLLDVAHGYIKRREQSLFDWQDHTTDWVH